MVTYTRHTKLIYYNTWKDLMEQISNIYALLEPKITIEMNVEPDRITTKYCARVTYYT